MHGLSFLLISCGPVAIGAGYKVEVQVDTASGVNRYTWKVHNEDEAWGLDQFVIEVPVQTKVLSYTVPPPYSNPDGNAYWIMQERQEPWRDAHEGRIISPAPRAGFKWLMWHGMESPSVYPPGATAVFTLTTDDRVKPGLVNSLAVTYTPQSNPHYYLAWQDQTTGPSALASGEATTSIAQINLLAGPIVNPANGHSYYLLGQSTWSNAEAQAVRLGGHLATIRNAEEDQWVYSTFGRYGGALWIGLTDRDHPSSYRWTSGEPVSYSNWGGGQPDHGGGVEFYAHIWPPGHTNPPSGKWNDYADADSALGFALFGVAEVAPASTPKLELSTSTSATQAQQAVIADRGSIPGPALQAFSAIELCWPTEANKSYRVQWTSSLDPPQWLNLEPLVAGTGTNVSIFDSTRDHPKGFYRVQVQE
ncbi:MAG TPA: C-type lectin domain-containing protein [Verrucomicrobiae bacterium]|nr:C-type lectin domain-containing protein [Verrucomicrobiae bacterium]